MARRRPGDDHGAMETRDHETTTTDTTPTRSAAPRRMKRSRDDRMVGGVCAGIARLYPRSVQLVLCLAAPLTLRGIRLQMMGRCKIGWVHPLADITNY